MTYPRLYGIIIKVMDYMRDRRLICLHCFGAIDPFTGFCNACGKHMGDNVQTTPDSMRPRTILGGRYLIGSTLGRGGFGITYKAYDTVLRRRVAIKEFFPRGYTRRIPGTLAVGVSDQKTAKIFNYWLQAFIQEAKVLSSIKSMEGIVSIYDFFLANNTAYIIMEFLDGVSLHRFILGRGDRLQLNETLNIMRPVLDTLLLLHQHGIIHKDVSPENIQIVNNKTVKLIDLGAASLYKQNVSKPFFVLKKGYSPIELYHNGSQGPWTDIYEVGATIYTCLVGTPPPEASARAQKDTLVPPSALNIKIQPVRENVLLKALAVNPQDRYSDVDLFRKMLYGDFLQGT